VGLIEETIKKCDGFSIAFSISTVDYFLSLSQFKRAEAGCREFVRRESSYPIPIPLLKINFNFINLSQLNYSHYQEFHIMRFPF